MNKSDLLNVFGALNADTFTPSTDISDISSKFFLEASSQAGNTAFRLSIENLVLDTTHSKFKIMRSNVPALVELMYPNAKENITLKISLGDAEDKVFDINLEDPEYSENFSAFIIAQIDEMIRESAEAPSKVDDSVEGLVFGGAPEVGMTGNAPMWESAGDIMSQFMNLTEMVLKEADEEDVPDDLGGDDLGGFADNSEDFPDDMNAEGGDEFGADEFSMDDEGGMDDFSPDMGGFGGDGTFGDEDEAGDVNADGGGEEGESFMQFTDKTDWTNEALRNMQSLVATAASSEMGKTDGVILTQDEVLNGTSGMTGDTNHDIVEKFLKVYKELDGIDITEDFMNQIEDKLEISDDQFDSWLQSKLGEITGSAEVNDTLDNDMFNEDFDTMGGEDAEPESEDQGFEDDGSFEQFVGGLDAEEHEDDGLRDEAEGEVEEKEKSEFPNV